MRMIRTMRPMRRLCKQNRGIAATAILCFVLNCGDPAAAMSTSQEIAQGQKESQEIDSTNVIIHDPFLVSWVNRVGTQLKQHRARTDINYTFTILQDPSINAFSIKGGFVHVNIGLLNFVSSDDELAATLGHEMGHVELHHVTKSDNTSAIIGILEGIASIFSVPAAVLGSIGGELASEKYSRIHELQADRYGVSIMAKAGYDPQAAVDVMRKLGNMDPGPGSRADKAFLDHPVPSDRVAHLLGYPELDRLPTSALVARAIHDEAEGRYTYAQARLLAVSKRDANAQVSAGATLRQLDYALRESGGLAAPGSRAWTKPILPNDPRRTSALGALQAAQSAEASAFQTAKDAARTGELELGDVVHHLESLEQPEPAATPESADARATAKALTRDFVTIVNLADDVLQSAPGSLSDNRQAFNEMIRPLGEDGALTPKSAALLPSYPRMTSDLQGSTTQLVSAVADARAAVADLGTAVRYFTDARRAAESDVAGSRDRASAAERARRTRESTMLLLAAADAALAKANHASDEMYTSQTITLSARLSLLDLFSAPERYAAFQRALSFRFPGVSVPTYAEAQHLGMPAGELGCGAWLAFETSRPLLSVLADMQRSNRGCGSLSTDAHLSAESLEIAEGLLYEDYSDSPASVGS